MLPYRAKGTIDGVVLTLIDVTGLKAAEDALFHERYLLNSLLARVPDAIYFKDATGRIIRANDAMAKRLGLSAASEAVGKSLFELPDREAALSLGKEDEAILKGGEPQLSRLEKTTRTGDGAGIGKDMLENVFDLFVQSKRTLDRSEGGLGVGLTLVRGLVDMHGGTVTARSAGEGKGSEFVVELPFADSVEAEPIHLRPAFHLPRGALVAVVEDNEDNRQTLCELLELAGFRCLSAGDGVSAFSLITEAHPDAALIDIGLPGMDGLALAKRLRDQPEHARMYLIALSGYSQPSDRMNALRAGFDEHLVKPVNSDRLLALLSEVSSERDSPAM